MSENSGSSLPSGALPQLPELEGRYDIKRELGRGGMATVFLARDLRHGRDVALKVTSDNLGATAADRFTREIALTARLSHPNILPLLDSGRLNSGAAFYVMPFVDGGSLRDRIAASGELPIADAVRIAADVADALDYGHKSGVVHRDVKPENILLQQGRPVVADFGIARMHADTAERLTATGVVVGTPSYMAPEQITSARPVDGRADVYALGCVLFEMLTGAPPFSGPNARAVMARHAVDERPSIRAVRPEVPPAVERVVHRAMARVPADRYASAGEFREALIGQTNARPRWTTVAAVTAVAAAAAVLVAVAIGVYARRSGSAAPTTVQAGVPDQDSARVAVLPMSNLSPDTSDGYFAAGMTDELISTLSDIQGIRVVARTAVMQYASSTRTLSDIGRELGVGSIIESTIRKDGRRLRISVRLVDARTQEPRWSQQYDREVSDVFAIQRDVAQHVADALRVRLGARESSAAVATTSEAALELYLRGRSVDRGSLTEAQADSSIAFLERAIALDSNFAVAYAELASSYVVKLFRFAPGPRYRALAERAVNRALQLDTTLAEAYQARGDLHYTPEAGWRLEDALRDFQRALALKPSLATAHGKLGVLLMHLGIYEPALRELRTSMGLDPFQTFAALRIGRSLWQSQKFDSALAAFERGPSVIAEHGMVYAYLGRPAEGLEFLSTQKPDLTQGAGDIAAARAVLHAQLGHRADAEREIRFASTWHPDGAHFHHAAFSLGVANVLLGRQSEAVRWLKQMANNGMPAYELLANDPIVRRLAGNADYEDLLAAERRRYDRLRSLLE